MSMGRAGQITISAESYKQLVSGIEMMAVWAGLKDGQLKKYYIPLRQESETEGHELEPTTMMRQFAVSLQNTGRMHNVVKLTADNEEGFEEALCGFKPAEIGEKLQTEQGVLNALKGAGLTEKTRLRTEKGRWTDWGKYAADIITAATYLSEDAVRRINEAIVLPADSPWQEGPMSDLPREISSRVIGIGPALALDFLKECGCLWASKCV